MSGKQQGISKIHKFLSKSSPAKQSSRSGTGSFTPPKETVSQDDANFIIEFTDMIVSVLKNADEPLLHEILQNFGWNHAENKFKSGDVDIEGLKIALSKRSRMLFSRASHNGNVDTTKCFVPEILATHLLGLDYEDLKPFSVTMDGICLLVDISGFTRLSGSFCAQGKDGIDGLHLATNGFMGQLVEVIYAHGGDIIKFAGDALICLFVAKKIAPTKKKRNSVFAAIREEGDEMENIEESSQSEMVGIGTIIEALKNNEPLEATEAALDVCMRAMLCAVEVREICTEGLTVHVGMSRGDICFGILGGCENRWDCLISGSCLFDLAQCLDDASSKESVISKAVYDRLGADCLCRVEVKELPSGNYQLLSLSQNVQKHVFGRVEEISDSTIEAYQDSQFISNLSRFVPFPVLAGFSSGGLTYIGEIREVTTIFMKWDSYDAGGKHKDLMSLQQCFFTAQTLVAENGGFIRQFLVDDKGCVLIACWGVPTASYFDNSHRALSTAVLMRDALKKLDMETSYGITTGNVYCGTVGCSFRAEYAVVGDVVNMSARLMCKAHGGIFIDEATYDRLPFGTVNSLQELEPMMVKGKSTPLKVFSYISTNLLRLKEVDLHDYEVRAGCKQVLLQHLEWLNTNSLFNRTSASKPSPAGTPMKQPSFMRRAVSFVQPQQRAVKFIIMEGKVGAGKSTTMKWFRSLAKSKDIRVASIYLQHKDCVSEFRVLARLFRQLIHEDVFDDPNKQRRVVMHILKQTYGDDRLSAEQFGYPTMQFALGVNAPVTGGYSRPPMNNIVDTLVKLFTFIFNELPTIVIVENIHFADEMSLVALYRMRDILSKSVIILTAIGPDEFDEFRSMQADTCVSPVMQSAYEGATGKASTEDNSGNDPLQLPTSFDWIDTYRGLLVAHPLSTQINMGSFTIEEIEAVLQAYAGDSAIPTSLAELVFKLSGGDTFWVKEMLLFIKETGAEQFFGAVNDTNKTAAVSNKRTSAKPLLSASAGKAVMSLSISTGSKASSEDEKVEMHRSQLELFLVCRLEKLSVDEQKVLRTASIIGYKFSRYVLYGVLSHHLKAHMYDSLRGLLKQNWITASNTDPALYHFTHPMMQHTLYDLTPGSDRQRIHHSIAEYVEETNPNDPVTYRVLAKHYALCNPAKAFEYFVRDACSVISQPEGMIDMTLFVRQLSRAVQFCTCTTDTEMLLELLDRANTGYYTRTNNINTSSHTPRSAKQLHRSTSFRGNRSNEGAGKPSLFAMLFLCVSCAQSDVVPSANSAPISNVHSNDSVDSYAEKSGAFTTKARDFISMGMLRLENEIFKLSRRFEAEGVVGTMQEWQKRVMGLVDEEERSMMSFSSFSTSARHMRPPEGVSRRVPNSPTKSVSRKQSFRR